MEYETMTPLSELGWNQYFADQWERLNAPQLIPARIAAEHLGAYDVWTAAGEGPAHLAGRLRHQLEDGQLPGVGDWVLLGHEPTANSLALIEHVFEHRTQFVRGAAGRETRTQIVAANVDLVMIVCGLDADYNLRRIERYLALVWAGGAQPLIVLNKADLCENLPETTFAVEMRCPGAAVIAVSALHHDGLATIRTHIRSGVTVALVGSSGAGKTTLVNALLGEQRMATHEVRARDGRGMHTTTHRQLTLLPDGGLLLDTPGMRELQLPDDAGLDDVFADIRELAAGCRFSDCTHDTEPGCAVIAAVEQGVLSAERLEHFRQLQREAQAYERRHDSRLRKQNARLWGQLQREGQYIRRKKWGK